MRDPVCGMDVDEKGAQHYIHFEHETIYFCSQQCRESYARKNGIETTARKKGILARFLEKLAQDNNKTFGGTPPSCH